VFFKQFYDQSLAQASYMIGCQATGDAIVVDPLRDVQPYLTVAAAEGLRISHVTETHIHADFVSGARELVSRTGAALYLSAEGGTDWQYAFAAADGATLIRHGDVINVGNIRLDVLHTPGHTPEHLSFVVTDQPAGAGAMGVITGDFVFVGDVGRPDLLEKAAKVANTMEAGARTLFHSLERFRALPDHLQVWPGHGAGSACGKALGAVPSSTVGYEKRANWGVGTTNETEFVSMVLEGQPEPPAYFAQMKRINRDGPPVLGTVTAPRLLDAETLPALAQNKAWIVDLRAASAFAAAHIPGSLSIPYSRSFSTWAGWLLPYDAELYLLTDETAAGDVVPESVRRAVHDMMLIGLDRVAGWFDASAFSAWERSGQSFAIVPQIDATSLATRRESESWQVLDVRAHSEFVAGHLPHALNIPVGLLPDAVGSLDPHRPIVVQCQSGARSMIGASVLMRGGRDDVINLTGGFTTWRAAGLPVERGTEVLT
jgi:hydroxyacylglutathione hydrolase